MSETGEILCSPVRRSSTIGELTKALCAANLEFGVVEKDTENPFYKSTYTDLASLIKATRPALAKHGLAVLQWPLTRDSRAGVTTQLLHTSGEWEEADFTLPVTKMDAQGSGSAITYSRRYAYQSILNVAGEEDDDGNAATGKSKGQVLAKLAEHEADFDQRAEGEKTLLNAQLEFIKSSQKSHGITDTQLAAFIKTQFNVNKPEHILRRDFDKVKDFTLGKIPLQDALQTSVEAVAGKTTTKTSKSSPEATGHNWALLYATAKEKQITQDEIKQFYTRKYKVTSGTELTEAQFAALVVEVATWNGPSITG